MKVRQVITYKDYFRDFMLGSNIFRVFCFFDEGRLVVLLSGFQKKTQKTPTKEIEKAERLKKEYYEEKRKEQKK